MGHNSLTGFTCQGSGAIIKTVSLVPLHIEQIKADTFAAGKAQGRIDGLREAATLVPSGLARGLMNHADDLEREQQSKCP
jgi:hypothetical protein